MSDDSKDRPDPEVLLRQIEQQERRESQAKLKVFLGYASGVGKSYQCWMRPAVAARGGEDVVVARPNLNTRPRSSAWRPKPRSSLRSKGMEPRLWISRRSCAVIRGWSSLTALLTRIRLGARNPQRWMDISDILRKGISVIASVNLQYIDELKDEVEAITGKRARDGIPRSFLDSADDIVLVDCPAAGAPEEESSCPGCAR